MKIAGPAGSPGVVGPAGARRSAAAPGFAPTGAGEGATAASGLSASTALGGLDALLMLQEPEDGLTRRRRAVRRADGLLDRLDTLKLSLLGEGEPQVALQRLAQALRERRTAVDDDLGLTDLLDAVETRAAVELAKLEMRGPAGTSAGLR